MIRRKERERERLGGKICAGNPQSTDAGQVLKRWTDSAGSTRAITNNVGINRDARLPSWPSATSPYQTSTIARTEIITNAKCDYFLFPDSLSTFSPAAGQQRAELCAFNPSRSLPSVGEGRTGWHQPALQNFRRGAKETGEVGKLEELLCTFLPKVFEKQIWSNIWFYLLPRVMKGLYSAYFPLFCTKNPLKEKAI